MVGLAAVVVLPMLLCAVVQSVYRQSPSRCSARPWSSCRLALLLTAAVVQLVQLALAATDALSTAVASSGRAPTSARPCRPGRGPRAQTATGPSVPAFVVLLGGLLVAFGAFVLWVELLVRAAAVYVAVLFLPLALASLVWPAISHWCRRLVDTLVALVLSKFVIVAILSLAVGALASGTGTGFAAVLAGGALLLLAAFTPFTLLRLMPAVEAGAALQLEGARHRVRQSLPAPRTAASFALRAAGAGPSSLVPGGPGSGLGASSRPQGPGSTAADARGGPRAQAATGPAAPADHRDAGWGVWARRRAGVAGRSGVQPRLRTRSSPGPRVPRRGPPAGPFRDQAARWPPAPADGEAGTAEEPGRQERSVPGPPGRVTPSRRGDPALRGPPRRTRPGDHLCRPSARNRGGATGRWPGAPLPLRPLERRGLIAGWRGGQIASVAALPARLAMPSCRPAVPAGSAWRWPAWPRRWPWPLAPRRSHDRGVAAHPGHPVGRRARWPASSRPRGPAPGTAGSWSTGRAPPGSPVAGRALRRRGILAPRAWADGAPPAPLRRGPVVFSSTGVPAPTPPCWRCADTASPSSGPTTSSAGVGGGHRAGLARPGALAGAPAAVAGQRPAR